MELDRIKQTQLAHENSAGSACKLQKCKIESFQWAVEDANKTVLRKSAEVFLSMKNCLLAAQKEVLKSKERMNYITTDVLLDEDDLVRKVFLYYLKGDYSDICKKKCEGCKSNSSEIDHENFCIHSLIPIIDTEIGHKAFAKISAKRILKGCLILCHLFNVPKTSFTLSKCHAFVEEFDKFEYDEFLECEFEFEMNLLDD